MDIIINISKLCVDFEDIMHRKRDKMTSQDTKQTLHIYV